MHIWIERERETYDDDGDEDSLLPIAYCRLPYFSRCASLSNNLLTIAYCLSIWYCLLVTLSP